MGPGSVPGTPDGAGTWLLTPALSVPTDLQELIARRDAKAWQGKDHQATGAGPWVLVAQELPKLQAAPAGDVPRGPITPQLSMGSERAQGC